MLRNSAYFENISSAFSSYGGQFIVMCKCSYNVRLDQHDSFKIAKLKRARRMNITAEETDNLIQIVPESLGFGCLCVGLKYCLTVKVRNYAKNGIRMRFAIAPLERRADGTFNAVSVEYERKQVAPGMSAVAEVFIDAQYAMTSKYVLEVFYGVAGIRTIQRIVPAYVVPVEIFTALQKNLELHKKKILSDSVRIIGRLSGALGCTAVLKQLTGDNEPKNLSSTMDADDEEELLDLPLVTGVVWYPQVDNDHVS